MIPGRPPGGRYAGVNANLQFTTTAGGMVISAGAGIYAGFGNNKAVGGGGASYADTASTGVMKQGRKYYWETKLLVDPTTGNCSLGAVKSGVSISSFVGGFTNSLGLANITSPHGTWYVGNVSTHDDAAAIAANNIYGIALDLVNGKVWIHKNGTYYSGNPSTGTSPSSSSIALADWYVAAAGTQVNLVEALRNASELTYSIPTGFILPSSI